VQKTSDFLVKFLPHLQRLTNYFHKVAANDLSQSANQMNLADEPTYANELSQAVLTLHLLKRRTGCLSPDQGSRL
jgi:hypothetical protein